MLAVGAGGGCLDIFSLAYHFSFHSPSLWIIVGQGPTVLAVGAGGGCLTIFSLAYHFSFLSPSLWETARYRLKYCLKGPLSPKQPTNQSKKESTTVFDFLFPGESVIACSINTSVNATDTSASI